MQLLSLFVVFVFLFLDDSLFIVNEFFTVMVMSASNCRQVVLSLYRDLLRESKQFESYIFRKYFVRRVRDAFRDNRDVIDEKKIKELVKYGEKNLEIIKRQVVISKLYKSNKLVVENETSLK